MATITIRRLDDDVKRRLRLRAAANGRSMEDEARRLLSQAVWTSQPVGGNMADAIRAIVEPVGGVEIVPPNRQPPRAPPDFRASDDAGPGE